MLGCLDLLEYIYSLFGYKFSLGLSTMPDNHLGTVDIWEKA